MMITKIDYTVVQIAAGLTHVLALDIKGTVYGWGRNSYGQLTGDPIGVPYVLLPQVIKGLLGKNVGQIYAGDYNSCAVTKLNAIYVWGLVRARL